MKTNAPGGGLWPTPDQRLLLRLCLGLEPDVAAAYARWRELVDIDRLTGGTFRLLPLLSARLQAAGVRDDKSELIAGTQRLAWARGRLALHTLAELADLLDEIEVPFIVLKGSALLIDGTYDEPGLRPSNDIDLLIRPETFSRARSALLKRGWSASSLHEHDEEDYLASCHALPLRRGESERLDLHWNAFLLHGRDQTSYEFLWDHAAEHTYDARRYRTLSPTEQLLQTAVHGARHNNREEPLRWLADAWLIIERHEASIDWSRLVDNARRRRHVLPLARTLRYLARELPCRIPSEVLDTLDSVPVARIERIERWFDERRSTRARVYARRLCRIARLAESEHPTVRARLRELPRYTRTWLAVPARESIARHVARRYRAYRDRRRAATGR